MKKLLLSILLSTSFARAEVLFQAPAKATDTKQSVATNKVIAKIRKPAQVTTVGETGLRSWSMVSEGPTTIVNSSATELMNDLKIGAQFEVEIPMSVMAFADGKAPVVGHFDNEGQEYRILGEAAVERNSKRISISFTKIRREASPDIFDFKASALAMDGTYGLEGEVHSGKAKFFLAELLSAAAAAFTDASVNRPVNALGNQFDENSLDTSSKKALTGALAKSGEHFAEEMKQNQEYVTIDGPLKIHMLITEPPKRKIQ